MRKLSVIASLLLSIGGSAALAHDAEGRWNMLPEEKQAALTAKAAEMGVDISTPEGRQALHEAKRAERAALAASMGFDVATPEGKQAFRQAMHEKRAVIKERVSSLPVEQRQALRDEMKGLSRDERRALLASRYGS